MIGLVSALIARVSGGLPRRGNEPRVAPVGLDVQARRRRDEGPETLRILSLTASDPGPLIDPLFARGVRLAPVPVRDRWDWPREGRPLM
jgi:hypothetical protein